ncbi:MAG: AI-2E family transporter [Solobacterium sp.]|nr:AI-2E family transporter [Solobacterium sp.]
MKERWPGEKRTQIEILTISGILIAAVCFGFMHWGDILSFLKIIWTALNPFLWGLCIAFILAPLRRLSETKWLKNVPLKPKAKRVVSVILSVVIFLCVLLIFFYILIPQLVSSFETLASSMDGYIATVERFLNNLGQSSEVEEVLLSVYQNLKANLVDLITSQYTVISKVLSYSVTLVKGVFNFFVGIIIAVYLLLDQERWIRQAKQVAYAFLAPEHAESIFRVVTLTSDMLDSFIFGKALDSLIIGIATAICCSVMKFPYTSLIAFVVGITNMIPVFGPFIGAIPCAFILLIISPAKALEFVVFILILQQVDGNILGPYILGDSMGLPPIYITLAIILGGTLWGVLGMFLGVPLFSVIYVLMKETVFKRLKEKHIKVT